MPAIRAGAFGLSRSWGWAAAARPGERIEPPPKRLSPGHVLLGRNQFGQRGGLVRGELLPDLLDRHLVDVDGFSVAASASAGP